VIVAVVGGVLVAARGDATAVVGWMARLADIDTGGWIVGGLAVARSAVAAGRWLVRRVVDAADGGAPVDRGVVAAGDGGFDAAPGVGAGEYAGMGGWAVGGVVAVTGGWAAAQAADGWTVKATQRVVVAFSQRVDVACCRW